MATARRTRNAGIREISYEEGWALLKEQAQRLLHMGAAEFIRKWQAAEFGDPDETNPDISSVVMMLPFVGVDPWTIEPALQVQDIPTIPDESQGYSSDSSV